MKFFGKNFRTLSITFFTFIFCLFLSPLLNAEVVSAGNNNASKIKVIPSIAITQIVGHKSLDEVRQGIVDELKDSGYDSHNNIHIMFSNAQGSVVVASQIAQLYVAKKPSVIVAIATPSAQSMVNAAKHTDIPIVFAAVTDPVQAKLVTNLEHPGGNVTGTINLSPIYKQLEFIKTINPNIKKIGVLLNFGEANSAYLSEQIKLNAKKLDMEVIFAGTPTSAEVQPAVESLMKKIDALFLVQDNTVASALPVVLKTTLRYNVPVFSTYLSAVETGALAGLAYDDYAVGRQTGKIVVRILKGENPGDIPVQLPQELESAINMDTVKKLNLEIAPNVLKEIEHVYPVSSPGSTQG